MVARADVSRDEFLRQRRSPGRYDRDRGDDLGSERARLLDNLDALAADFRDAPDQVGRYLAGLELRGTLGQADEDPIYAHLQDTVGLAFADEVFRRADTALASPEALLAEIQADAGLGAWSADAALDPDRERAAKTAEILAALSPALDLDARQVVVHADADARAATHARGLDGLMRDGEVYVDPDRYDPSTHDGRRLLAHEVVHLAQRENHLRGASTPASLPAAEREADTLSSRFAAGERTGAPLAALTAYDQAACGGPALHDTPDRPTPDKPKEGPQRRETRRRKRRVSGPRAHEVQSCIMRRAQVRASALSTLATRRAPRAANRRPSRCRRRDRAAPAWPAAGTSLSLRASSAADRRGSQAAAPAAR